MYTLIRPIFSHRQLLGRLVAVAHDIAVVLVAPVDVVHTITRPAVGTRIRVLSSPTTAVIFILILILVPRVVPSILVASRCKSTCIITTTPRGSGNPGAVVIAPVVALILMSSSASTAVVTLGLVSPRCRRCWLISLNGGGRCSGRTAGSRRGAALVASIVAGDPTNRVRSYAHEIIEHRITAAHAGRVGRAEHRECIARQFYFDLF